MGRLRVQVFLLLHIKSLGTDGQRSKWMQIDGTTAQLGPAAIGANFLTPFLVGRVPVLRQTTEKEMVLGGFPPEK